MELATMGKTHSTFSPWIKAFGKTLHTFSTLPIMQLFTQSIVQSEEYLVHDGLYLKQLTSLVPFPLHNCALVPFPLHNRILACY